MTKKNGKIITVAADCTGHGVPGAFMSMLGMAFLNEITSKVEDIHANEILEDTLNEWMAETSQIDDVLVIGVKV